MLNMEDSKTKAEALHALFTKYTPQKKVEWIPCFEAMGRVTSESIYSRNTLPVVRASMMDGIAVSSELFKDGIPDTSEWEIGREYVRADTGDDFDDRFDAVIAIEDVSFDQQGKLQIKKGLQVKKNTGVRKRGSLINEGDKILSAKIPINSSDLAAMVLGGITEVPVYKKPIAAFIPTGSELVPAGTVPQRGQNVDSNSILVKNMLLEMGAVPICYPIIKDSYEELEISLERALKEADFIIVNGGSSKGEEDLTTKVMKRKGDVLVHGISAGPGRPMSLSVVEGKPVINLSGPIVAAYYGMDWCIRAIVNQYLGLPMLRRQRVKAILTEDMPCPMQISFLCRINIKKADNGTYLADPVPFKVVSMGSCMTTNAQFISEIGQGDYKKGDEIEVELLRSEELVNTF